MSTLPRPSWTEDGSILTFLTLPRSFLPSLILGDWGKDTRGTGDAKIPQTDELCIVSLMARTGVVMAVVVDLLPPIHTYESIYPSISRCRPSMSFLLGQWVLQGPPLQSWVFVMKWAAANVSRTCGLDGWGRLSGERLRERGPSWLLIICGGRRAKRGRPSIWPWPTTWSSELCSIDSKPLLFPSPSPSAGTLQTQGVRNYHFRLAGLIYPTRTIPIMMAGKSHDVPQSEKQLAKNSLSKPNKVLAPPPSLPPSLKEEVESGWNTCVVVSVSQVWCWLQTQNPNQVRLFGIETTPETSLRWKSAWEVKFTRLSAQQAHH